MRKYIALILFVGLTPISSVFAEVGVTNTEITFGQSAALSGPASALGTGMNLGILSAFEEANKAGGVHGRLLKVVSYDDKYEPDLSITNTNKLINGDKVFGLIGAVGTPTSSATQPIATKNNVPFIGPLTGASFLRKPENSNVINFRATYDQETETWIEHLTTDLNITNIAILYQDDGFGRVGLAGVEKAMKKRGLEISAVGTYPRNTTAIKKAVLSIRKAKPKAVVMVGAYKPIAEFIKLAKKTGIDATFINISFVGSKALSSELGKDGAGVVITQVVPFPWNNSLAVVDHYQKALKAYDPSAEYGFVSLEGYIVGKLTIEALKRAGKDLTRQNFYDAIYKTEPYDLGGIKLTYGPNDNQGSENVFLTIIQEDGSFRTVNKLGS